MSNEIESVESVSLKRMREKITILQSELEESRQLLSNEQSEVWKLSNRFNESLKVLELIKAELAKSKEENEKSTSLLITANFCISTQQREIEAVKGENEKLKETISMLPKIPMEPYIKEVTRKLQVATEALECYKGVEAWASASASYGESRRHYKDMVADKALCSIKDGL